MPTYMFHIKLQAGFCTSGHGIVVISANIFRGRFCTFRDRVLCQFARQNQPYGTLNFPTRDGLATRLVGKGFGLITDLHTQAVENRQNVRARIRGQHGVRVKLLQDTIKSFGQLRQLQIQRHVKRTRLIRVSKVRHDVGYRRWQGC